MSNNVFIGLGSNIEPEKNIISAVKILKSKTDIVKSSFFYKTVPFGMSASADYFVNGVLLISTEHSPYSLKNEILLPLEKSLGRNRDAGKYNSREIDLDILLFNNLILNTSNFTFPNPDIYTRYYNLRCILDIDPDKILPDGRSAYKILESMDSKGIMLLKDLSEKILLELET